MKLFYNKNSKDPIYYAQLEIRNGKKVTTRNIKKFGKHSELLKITDDYLALPAERHHCKTGSIIFLKNSLQNLEIF